MFKDIYMGRIVISSGIIQNHESFINADAENENTWVILTEKESIKIEDAIPMVKLSRKRKIKKVIGVLWLNTRKNTHPERLIINLVGEGAIWVCSSNGNIENGDYITSSDYLGYGEKQDDDLLHNYTVAKSTMSCDFQLDHPYYECKEIDDLEAFNVPFLASIAINKTDKYKNEDLVQLEEPRVFHKLTKKIHVTEMDKGGRRKKIKTKKERKKKKGKKNIK